MYFVTVYNGLYICRSYKIDRIVPQTSTGLGRTTRMDLGTHAQITGLVKILFLFVMHIYEGCSEIIETLSLTSLKYLINL
jgi:hypothetical protein